MITVKKLYTLKKGTRLRKILRILEETERIILDGSGWDPHFFHDLLRHMKEDADLTDQVVRKVQDLLVLDYPSPADQLRRGVNSLRHALLSQLEISPADWDFIHPGDQAPGEKRNFFKGMTIYLDEIRSPFNVGSIFRTAESLGAQEIYLSPGTADPFHPRAQRTSMGCVEKILWKRLDYEGLKNLNGPFFALELGGPAVNSFSFPEKGILILGSEEVGVSPECLALSDQSLGRVTIPLYGWKGSLNVSVAFGIVLQQWVQAISV